jgi:hypothetical protein
MKTGWSRAEIMTLAPAEFNHYVRLIVARKTDS